MSRRHGGYYDDDDYDDYYEDDYGDYDDVPAQKPKNVSKKPQSTGKAAGGAQRGKGQQKGASSRPAPAAKTSAAQQVGSRHGGNPPPAKRKETPQKNGGDGSATTSAAEKLQEMKIVDSGEEGTKNEGPSSKPEAQKSTIVRRPLSEYQMETDLARLCDGVDKQGGRDSGLHKLHLIVLGHVDAGKSTLMGRLLYDLGEINKRDVHKNEKMAEQMGKASFSWAFALDARPEERERGVTVDVAMSHFQTKKYHVTLLDAPGHRDFIPNMISGAAQADAAILCVDGSTSGFEAGFKVAGRSSGGGQTREHAQLARTLGIEQVAVVVTKLDTCNFSKERFEEIRSLLEPFLLSSGFKTENIQWLPASAPEGLNLVSPPEDKSELGSWWKGPTVVDAIDAFNAVSRRIDVPLRLPVSDVFKSQSLGRCAVSGKLEGGAMRVGGEVLVLPAGEIGTIRAIEVDGEGAQIAKAGDNCCVGLPDIDPSLLFPGSVLCTPLWPIYVATKFELRVLVLDPPVPIIPGQAVALHAHMVQEAGKISKLISVLDPKTGKITKQKPRCLSKGNTAVIEVAPDRSMCLEEYASYRALGRVAVRQVGRTVAVGIVTSISE